MGALSLSSRAIIGEFYNRLSQNPGTDWVGGVSSLFTSNQESETYKWLGMAPTMREWIGGRNAKGFRENGLTIKNKTYEATLEVLLDEIRRDKTGQVMTRVREMADRTNAHWASLLSTLIINGEASVCYDGEYFFDTDHSEGSSGSQSNDLAVDISALPCSQHGSTTAPSIEEMELSVLQAVSAIYGFKDDQGEPMNENANQFILMVPVSLLPVALAATTLPQLTGGKSALIPAQNGFNIRAIANPRLTWTTKFALFRTDGETKPFIRQQEEDVTISAIAEGSELEFTENKHLYGVKAIRNVGYGYWQHSCLVTMG